MSINQQFQNISGAINYHKGSIILQENDSLTKGLFILLKGSANVYKNYGQENEQELDMLAPGDFFGEQALLLDVPQPATIIAITDVVVLKIEQNGLRNFISAMPGAALVIMQSFLARISALAGLYENNGSPITPVYGDLISALTGNAPGEATPPSPAQKPEPTTDIKAKMQEALAKNRAEADAKKTVAPPAPAKNPMAQSSPQPAHAGAKPETPLFPVGHKETYTLPEQTTDPVYFLEKSYVCPLCKAAFKMQSVKTSKLVTDFKDPDTRVHYKNIEPLYYDIITCPSCAYSAPADTFKDPVPSKKDVILAKLGSYKQEAEQCKADIPRDAASVFTAYYLSMIAHQGFPNNELLYAKTWLKLGWLYDDAGDFEMGNYALKQSLDYYYKAYNNLRLPVKQMQSLHYIMGELTYKLGDVNKARDFFFRAKTEREGSPGIKKQADQRLEEIKDSLES